MAKKPVADATEKELDLAIGVTPGEDAGVITARKAGGLTDLELSVSPRSQSVASALRHLAKALNIALKLDFIETELDRVYKVARVRKGTLHILHKDYIGLGDGILTTFGKATKSFQLTFRGPDAGSPEGEQWIAEHGRSSLTGILNLIGRKLDVLQEFEDKVPFYVEQTLDRLEAKRIITDWHRNEWKIETTLIGMDVIMTPQLEDTDE